MTGKRTSIRQRLQRIVLIISATALIITSVLGIVMMLVIRSQSETGLAEETRSNLRNIVENKADLADTQLIRYVEYAEEFAAYLTGIYENPDKYIPREAAQDEHGYICAPIRRSEDIDIDDFKDETNLNKNVTDLLYPVVSDPSKNISAVYWGTEGGLLSGYEEGENTPPLDMIYDFWQVPWYSMCKEAQGTVFTDIYLDGFDRGLTITCATPFYDANGDFRGVFGVDVLISDLYEESVALDLGEGAYAFLVDNNGNVISPDGEAKPLLESEGIDQATADKLLAADGDVFLANGIYYTSARVESTGWSLCLHVPQNLAMAPVRSMDTGIRGTIIIFVIIFIIILAVVAYVIRRFSLTLTQPIIALEEDVKKISGGNLDYKAEVSTNDEIGDLAESFNDMSTSLRSYIDDVKKMTAEQERIGAELSVATKIQADMLPTNFEFPGRNEFDIYAAMTPAKEVGGDFYDFFLIDNDHLGLVMADVSGKGVPAALFMVIAKTMIKNRVMSGDSPAKALASVNDQLCENNEQNLFVTAWLGVLTLSTGEVVSADAGHEYPAISRGGDGFELMKSEHYPPLATIEGNEYVEIRFTLNAGDTLFLYTDGVPDAKSNDNERYGNERMLAAINAASQKSVRELIERVEGDVAEFSEGRDPFDDVTVMAIRYNGGR